MGRPLGSKNKPHADAIAPQGDDMVETATAPTLNLTLDQLKELLASSGTGSFSADDLAKAFKATQKQENVAAPMVTFCNPKGDRDHPKPAFLPRKITQNGIELDRDQLMVEEIYALNALRPGNYRVEKANGTKTPFTVNDVRGVDGVVIERREIHFPSKDENQADHKGLLDYCLDVLAQSRQTKDIEQVLTVRNEMAALRPAR
jgi:hypothetical protein